MQTNKFNAIIIYINSYIHLLEEQVTSSPVDCGALSFLEHCNQMFKYIFKFPQIRAASNVAIQCQSFRSPVSTLFGTSELSRAYSRLFVVNIKFAEPKILRKTVYKQRAASARKCRCI